MFLVSSCSNTDFDYSSLHAYFVFDNGQHQDATLQSALNPLSPGVFCRVSEGQEGAVTYFYFESNEGLSTKQKANADDMRRTRAIGLNNKLLFTSNGIVSCSRCKRQYNLNNNGLCINAEGKKLIKYRATCTNPLGILSVNN